MSDRRAAAIAALAALGIDADALSEGRLAADALLPLATGADAERLVAAIAELGSAGAGAALAALEPHVAGGTRRELRRGLYRLRQRGVVVPEHAPPAPEATPRAEPEGDVEAFVSTHDGAGDRLLWLVRRQPGGGSLVVAAQVNEPGGLRDVQVVDMTRKQIRAVRQRLAREGGVRLVPAPWRVVDALLVEAHERTANRERGRDYLRVRSQITAEPAGAPAEPVSRHAAAPDERDATASASLLGEPPFAAWAPDTGAVASFADEIGALRDSPIVLNELQQRERVRAVIRRAALSLYPAATLARRLEGTAYVLAESGKSAVARVALATATHLRTRPDDAGESPFVIGLVERALGTLLSANVARQSEERRSALVATPGEYLRARESSRRERSPG